MIEIRPEEPGDHAAVHEVIASAFGNFAEARLVDALRMTTARHVSLVATQRESVVGHIFFSPVELARDRSAAIALAPLAVAPTLQRSGIGGQLMRAGLSECNRIGECLVFVLGHVSYYPRFGFGPADDHGFYFGKPGPNPAFMVSELRSGAIAGRSGEVRYAPEFYDL